MIVDIGHRNMGIGPHGHRARHARMGIGAWSSGHGRWIIGTKRWASDDLGIGCRNYANMAIHSTGLQFISDVIGRHSYDTLA